MGKTPTRKHIVVRNPPTRSTHDVAYRDRGLGHYDDEDLAFEARKASPASSTRALGSWSACAVRHPVAVQVTRSKSSKKKVFKVVYHKD